MIRRKHLPTLTENRYSSKKFNAITFRRKPEEAEDEEDFDTFLSFWRVCVWRAEAFDVDRKYSRASFNELEWSVACDR
jgi:hypothetical protein